MHLFDVDQEQCTRCQTCTTICPAGIIEWNQSKSLPAPGPKAGSHCLGCGHCVAACPEGALSHRTMTSAQCPPALSTALLAPEQVETFLRSRRSIRNYKSLAVDRETLAELIRIASFAPSGHNSQPLSWMAIHQRDKLEKLGNQVVDWMRFLTKERPQAAKAMQLELVVAGWENGRDVIFRGAPHVILTHAAQKNPFAPAASTIALTYLELAAPSFDLGSCWLGYFQLAAASWPPLQEALGFPAGDTCLGALAVGHPKVNYQRLPLRKTPQISWR